MWHLSAPRSFHSIISYADTRALCVGLTPACYQCLLLKFPLVPTQPHHLIDPENNRDGLRLSITIILHHLPPGVPEWKLIETNHSGIIFCSKANYEYFPISANLG